MCMFGMGDVQIAIDNKAYSLADALSENKITMDEIIAKANKDIPDAPTYDDGGSSEVNYNLSNLIIGVDRRTISKWEKGLVG